MAFEAITAIYPMQVHPIGQTYRKLLAGTKGDSKLPPDINAILVGIIEIVGSVVGIDVGVAVGTGEIVGISEIVGIKVGSDDGNDEPTKKK